MCFDLQKTPHPYLTHFSNITRWFLLKMCFWPFLCFSHHFPRAFVTVLLMENKTTELFSKLTQMLPKNTKMTFCWLSVCVTLIRTCVFYSRVFFDWKRIYMVLVHLKTFFWCSKLKKIHVLSIVVVKFSNFLTNCPETKSGFSSTLEHQK